MRFFSLLILISVVVPARAQTDAQVEWFQNEAREWVGKSIPVFSFQDQDDRPITEETLKGRVTVLRFFFVGCPACRKETPKLNRIYDQFAPQGVQFVAFTFDPEERTRTFREWKNYRYRVVPDAKSFIQWQMHVGVYPTHMVVNPEGVVTAVILGTDPFVGWKIRRAIRRAQRNAPIREPRTKEIPSENPTLHPTLLP